MFTRGATMSEKEMLDKAHDYFVQKVENYSGYEFEKDKVTVGEKILTRAKQELL